MLLLLSSYYTLCCKQMLVWVFFTKNNSGLRGTCKLVLHAPAVDLESFTSTQEIKKLYSRPKSYIPNTINIEFTLCHHIQLIECVCISLFWTWKIHFKAKINSFQTFLSINFSVRTLKPKIVYRGSPTYTKITNTVSTNTVFGLCMCKWGN